MSDLGAGVDADGLMTPEVLLAKLEENTRDVMDLKLKVRQLEEEKIEKEMELSIIIEKHEGEMKEMQTHYEEEIQATRDELSSALEQIIQSDQQFDSLDLRKHEEMEGIFQQLEQAHQNIAELERSSMEEITRLNRLMEDTKDMNEKLTNELEDLKNEHDIVDKFRNEELNSFKRDLDELTDVVVALEQRRANEEATAIARFDELERAKNNEIEALRSQISASGAVPEATAAVVVARPKPTEPVTINLPTPRAEPSYVAKTEPRAVEPKAEPAPREPVKTWTPPASASKPAAKSWTPPVRAATEAPARPAWLSTKAAAPSKPAADAAAPTETPKAAASAPTTAAAPKPAPAAEVNSGPVSDLPQFSATELRGFLKTPATAPPGFDKSNAELYLNDAEFQPLFGCSKAVYTTYAKWKQDPLKRKAKLF